MQGRKSTTHPGQPPPTKDAPNRTAVVRNPGSTTTSKRPGGGRAELGRRRRTVRRIHGRAGTPRRTAQDRTVLSRNVHGWRAPEGQGKAARGGPGVRGEPPGHEARAWGPARTHRSEKGEPTGSQVRPGCPAGAFPQPSRRAPPGCHPAPVSAGAPTPRTARVADVRCVRREGETPPRRPDVPPTADKRCGRGPHRPR